MKKAYYMYPSANFIYKFKESIIRGLQPNAENIEKAISEGRFRQDSYHRINEFALEVPPLRERLEDFDELIAFFIEHFRKLFYHLIQSFSF